MSKNKKNKRLEHFSGKGGKTGAGVRSGVGDDRAEAQTGNQRQRKNICSSFSPLMRQEGQEERSAHAQSPRPNPIPFQKDRRLATPHLRDQEMGGGKHCILCYPAWPNAPKCQASLGFNETGWNGAENSHPGHMGSTRSQLPPLSHHDLPPQSALWEAVTHEECISWIISSSGWFI